MMDGEDGMLLNITRPSPSMVQLESQIKPVKRSYNQTYPTSPGQKKSKFSFSFSQTKISPVQSKKTYSTSNSRPEIKKKKASTTKKNKRPSSSSSGTGVISSLFTKNPKAEPLDLKTIPKKKTITFALEKITDIPDLSKTIVDSFQSKWPDGVLTQVQKLALPPLLAGRDAIVVSPTGTGKTMAYGIPLVDSLVKVSPRISRSDGIFAVVLVPTRELALQTQDVLQLLVHRSIWIVPGLIVGGEKRKAEKARLRKGINIVVCTPGRLKDHLETTKCVHFQSLKWLIIDEADQLLSMGFEKTIDSILAFITSNSPSRPQTVLLSATFDTGVERLSVVSLAGPMLVDASRDNRVVVYTEEIGRTLRDCSYTVPQQLNQYLVTVPAKLRLVAFLAGLIYLRQQCPSLKAIIFFSCKNSVDFHHNILKKVDVHPSLSPSSIKVYKLHGDMSPDDRSDVFNSFRAAETGLLLSTDLAARGLDLPRVDWIVQYCPANDTKEYVHRVGRTARIGQAGNALLFLMPHESGYATLIQQHGMPLKELGLQKLLDALVGNRNRTMSELAVREACTLVQDKLEKFVLSDLGHLKLARDAYLASIRAYGTYSAPLKHIFHIRNLHLGHLAKSFSLRECPKSVSSALGSRVVQKPTRAIHPKYNYKERYWENGGGIVTRLKPNRLSKTRNRD